MLTRLFKQGMDFKCIGSKCIDICCTGWDITFDQATYENLFQDPCFKKTMEEYAFINDQPHISKINYGIISLENDGVCPFLDRDYLCRIQKKRGACHLSNVCALYPRYYNTVDDTYEESLSLACIAAAEKLLLGGPLEIIEVERPPKRDVVLKTISTQANGYQSLGTGDLHDFRQVIFRVMRSENHTFDEKLGILMTFHEYIEDMDDGQLKAALKSYDFSCKKTPLSLEKRSFNKIILLLNRIGRSDHLDLDQLICACIKDSRYDQLKLDQLCSIDGILSNYLMHQMFKDLYPFTFTHSKMASFQYLLKKVQILRVLIAYDGNFDYKRVARIIQMYSKGLEHHGAFYYEIEEMVL